jgi:hypothetical protein
MKKRATFLDFGYTNPGYTKVGGGVRNSEMFMSRERIFGENPTFFHSKAIGERHGQHKGEHLAKYSDTFIYLKISASSKISLDHRKAPYFGSVGQSCGFFKAKLI